MRPSPKARAEAEAEKLAECTFKPRTNVHKGAAPVGRRSRSAAPASATRASKGGGYAGYAGYAQASAAPPPTPVATAVEETAAEGAEEAHVDEVGAAEAQGVQVADEMRQDGHFWRMHPERAAATAPVLEVASPAGSQVVVEASPEADVREADSWGAHADDAAAAPAAVHAAEEESGSSDAEEEGMSTPHYASASAARLESSAARHEYRMASARKAHSRLLDVFNRFSDRNLLE